MSAREIRDVTMQKQNCGANKKRNKTFTFHQMSVCSGSQKPHRFISEPPLQLDTYD